MRQRDRGLARGARDQDHLLAEVPIGDEVVRQKRGHEEASHQHQGVFVLGMVERVARRRIVLGVERRDALAMGRAVGDPGLVNGARFDDQIARHGVEAETASADGHLGVLRLDHVGVAHRRESSPALWRRERNPSSAAIHRPRRR